jgi:hypothetical protein
MAATVVDPKIAPGIKSEGTESSSRGRWVDGNLMRWYAGSLRPVGGWIKARETALTGKPRAAFPWRTNTLSRYVAVGTHNRLYVITPAAVYDASPTDLAEGRENTVISFGYGLDNYDQGTYGTPRTSGVASDATTWSFSNFGEWLLAVSTADGRLLKLEVDPINQAAAPVSGAPTNNQGVLVTPQRHVLLYGAGGDKRKLQWASSESLTEWTPSATNSAGNLVIPSPEPIKAASVYRTGVLVFAESSLYFLDYVGYPFVYGLSLVSSSSSIVSPHVVTYVGNTVVWMGYDKFYMFDGSLQEIPCEVRGFVFDRLNKLQAIKSFGFHLPKFSEVWWFFPTEDSFENDRYVVWNYASKIWYTGYVPRAAGWYSDAWGSPYMLSHDGWLYEHESGWTADGQSLGSQRYVVSSPIVVNEGDQHLYVQGIVPDRNPSNAVGFVLEGVGWPEDTSQTVNSGVLLGGSYIDCRFGARAFRARVVGVSDTSWEMGPFKLDVVFTGKRRR